MRAHEFTDQGAAGIILYAADTGRYGLQQRSDSINDPGQWAAWGGGREPGESLEQCARRELAEESGYTGPIKLKRLAENARYVTFIGVVPHEFEPRPDPEWKDYCWVEAGDWPSPMHPGVAAALKNIPVNENFADGKKATLREPFSKQVTVGDIELIAKSSGHNDLNIMAFVASDPNSPTIGMVKFWKDGSSLYSEKTTVLQDYQRQGIATLMYQFAKSLGFNIKPSKEKTHLGQKLWKGFANKDSLSKKTIASKKFTENFADGQGTGIDFLGNLLRLLQQKYPNAEFARRSDRVESLDDELTVIASTLEEDDYVGCAMWDVSTGPYTGVLMPAIKLTTEQLLRANPGKQPALFILGDNDNPEAWSHIAQRLGYELITDEDELDENFADGKVKGKSRPGRVKRAGASCSGSVSDLRAKARKYSGERGRMYHWCANMKAGKKK